MNCTHGIMFHHLHGGESIKSQGSLSAEEFENLILWYSKTHNIIDASEYYNRVMTDTIRDNDVVITFDDGLQCQYDIARPVLKKLGLTAFFFVYTLPLEGGCDNLEVFHHFRFFKFSTIDLFYEEFFSFAKDLFNKKEINIDIEKYIRTEKWKLYKPQSTFYTDNDRKFRYVRDYVFGSQLYSNIMYLMMNRYGYDYNYYIKKLWIREKELIKLKEEGHVIGLHSHTHPTVLAGLSYLEQKKEWEKCYENLTGFLGRITSASYPCDSYNDDTLKILSELGVSVAFRAYPISNNNRLLLPREDSSTLFREMKETK